MDVEHSAQNTSTGFWRYLQFSLPLLLLACWVVGFWPTFVELNDRWVKWDQSMAHGWPVALLFIFLLYKTLPWQPHRPKGPIFWLALIGLALGSLAWFVFHAVNVTILEQLVLLPLLILLFTAVFGIKQVFRHRLLLLFPVFAIPVWDYLNGPLLAMSSFIVGEMVRMAGMPALIEGSSIFIPHGHILIADGCSGLRYFVVALAMGYLIAYLNRYNEGRLGAVLVAAAALGLITNWIRIFVLIVIGYKTEMQSPLMADHEYFGWILFALICLPAIYFAPVVKAGPANESAETRQPPSFVSFLLPLLALGAGPLAALAVDLSPAKTPWQQPLANIGQSLSQPAMPLPLELPEGGYTQAVLLPKAGVHIQVDQFQRTTTAENLVPYFARLFNSESWRLAEEFEEQVGGHVAAASLFRHKATGRQVAQIQWFNTGGYISSSVPEAKLWQIPAVLRGRNHFQIITVQAICLEPDCTEAFAKLKQAAESLQP